ncbi:hypothetical protein B0H13DRAFT_1991068 [Mycena leptocephala]|nr:hypothetical protein B0H13DRAFT_1991068 [Mycena leptocephala]
MKTVGRRNAFGGYLWRIFPSPLPRRLACAHMDLGYERPRGEDQEAKRRCISILSLVDIPPRTWGVGYPTHVYDAAGSLTLMSPVSRLRLRKTRGDAEQLGAEQEPSRGTAGRRAWRKVSSVTVTVRGRNVDMSEGITHHLAWISCRARTRTGRMASEITEVWGTEYGREPAAAAETKVIANDGAASAARPGDFDDSQTARVTTAPRLCQKQTTNMVDAEDRFKAGTL